MLSGDSQKMQTGSSLGEAEEEYGLGQTENPTLSRAVSDHSTAANYC